MKSDPSVDTYCCFSDLAAHEERGKDYDLHVVPRHGAQVVVIAPHGGGIEPETAKIAQAIAGGEFSLYCFKGIKSKGNARLHITSYNFDEPECLSLLARHEWVLAIHGCDADGDRVFLGGRDKPLIEDLSKALQAVGINADTSGHQYPGEHSRNICNRNARGAGAQFELSLSFRPGAQVPAFVAAVRAVLANRQHAA